MYGSCSEFLTENLQKTYADDDISQFSLEWVFLELNIPPLKNVAS